ncbi:hypothetical protein D3C80_745250 [compost metagenome]
MGNVLGQLFGCANAELDGAGIIAARNHFADTVDVTADQVTAKAGGRRQGLFQVDPTAALEVVKGGAVQGFAADIGPEAIARQLYRR